MFSNNSFEFFVSAYIAIDVTFNILDENPWNVLFHKWQSIVKNCLSNHFAILYLKQSWPILILNEYICVDRI
jgi:hypothetical protein